MTGSTSLHTPDWVKHAVFYQIFPDSFARRDWTRASLAQGSALGGSALGGSASESAFNPESGRSPHPPSIDPYVPPPPANRLEAWDAPPTFQGFKGGNLWGIIDQLDYLQEVGFTALYLTPIFQSASNHRYHTHDYYQVDPMLGGNVAFGALRDAVHARGMHLVLDGVFNHASRGFFYFNDILENGGNSPWLDWFRVRDWPLAPYDGSKPANYDSWIGYRALPEFNHANPEVREYIMQVGEYWIRQGIDGWRLDVPNCVKVPDFWVEFRDRIKALNPEAYIVGEIWEDARPWLDGRQFDGVMNYRFTGPTIAFVAGDRIDPALAKDRPYEPYPAIDAATYQTKITALLARHPWEIQLTQLNLLASHDTARLLTMAGEDETSVTLATLLLLTFPGAPSIYYGDEVGLPGGLDPDSRRGFPSRDRWHPAILDTHRRLIALRRAHPALRTGAYEPCVAQGLLYGFFRGDAANGDRLLIWVNSNTQTATATLTREQVPADTFTTVLYGEGSAVWEGDRLRVAVPARSGLVLR